MVGRVNPVTTISYQSSHWTLASQEDAQFYCTDFWTVLYNSVFIRPQNSSKLQKPQTPTAN